MSLSSEEILSTPSPQPVNPDAYPSGPKKGNASLSAYFELHRNPLKFLKQLVDQYGEIVHLQLGPRHDYLISNPEHIKEVLLASDKLIRSTPRALSRLLGNGLLTSNQKFHPCQKRFLQPSFSPQSINTYAPVMGNIAVDVSRSWEGQTTIDIMTEMNHLTLNVVVQTLMGADLDEDQHEIAEAVETIKSLTDKKTIPFIDSLLWKIPCSRTLKFENARNLLDKKIYEIIRQKREKDLGATDMVANLLRIQKEEGPQSVLTDKQIRDEVMTMFMAGHETIGSALTWTWYLISQNPDIEKKLHQEVDSVLGNRNPSTDDVSKLVYTRKLFLEAMRLYPPVWLMVRKPVEEVTINGYKIRPGSYVHVSQYVVQRDVRYFPNPEKFDPERWTPEATAARPKFSYFPFGGGKRQCIGEGFAMTEGILAIATIAQNWSLRRADHHTIEIEPLITLRPKGGMRMNITKRTTS